MKELIIAFGLTFFFIRRNFICHISIKNEKYVKKIRNFIKDSQLRTGGLVFAIIGFIIIWYIKN